MLKAFKEGKYTDLTVTCLVDGSEFKVHKIILCTQSAFFRQQCDRIHDDEHAHDLIEIDGFEGQTVAKVFEFLYSGQYSLYDVDESCDSDDTDEISRENDFYRKRIKSEVQTHIDVLRAAEFMEISDLVQHTETVVTDFISTRMDDIFIHSDSFFLTILRMIIRDGQSDPIVDAIARAVGSQLDLLMHPDSLGYYRREFVDLLGSMSGKLAFTLLEKFVMPRVPVAAADHRLVRKRGYLTPPKSEDGA